MVSNNLGDIMKFFIILFMLFILYFLTIFFAKIIKIKKQWSEEIDISTWLRMVFDNATEADLEKYQKYVKKKEKEENERKEFEDRINNAEDENQSIEQIMLIFDELTNKYPYYDYFIDKADLYIENKKYDNALLEYKKAINSVDCSEFYFYKSYTFHLISNMYLDLKNYAKALKYATKAIRIHRGGYCHVDFESPADFTFCPLMYSKAMAYEDRAEIYFECKKYDLALKDIKKSIEETALDSSLIFHIKILIKLKRFNEAEQLCFKYFQQDNHENNFANYYACKGYIAHAQNDYRLAYEFYTKALNSKDELCFYEIEIIHNKKIECYKFIKNRV